MLSINANAQINKYELFYENLFSGNYKKSAKILSSINKIYPNDIKTKLAYANFYYLMYETTGKLKAYEILCKTQADYINNKLSGKDSLTYDEVFYLISAKSILLKIQFENKKYLNVAIEAQALKKHFKFALAHKTNSKLKLISGIYNYYIETAKEDYPVAYPILLFFPSGNKITGIKQLTECSKNENNYIKTRALLFLANIYKSDEKDFNKSEFYFLMLLNKYPNNVHWRKEYILTLRKYNKFEKAKEEKMVLLEIIRNNLQLIKSQKKYLKTI